MIAHLTHLLSPLIRQGYHAARERTLRDGNPYPADTLGHLAWDFGWLLWDVGNGCRLARWFIERRMRRVR